MDAQVFISFASQDDKVAKTLCSAVEARGYKCWISSRDILPGENFQVAIVRAIGKAKVLLLVFTANSNNSQEMNKELALASQGKLTVVPLRIDDVAPNEAFRYEFATRQWINFFADWELAMNQLTAQIGHIVGEPALPTTPPPVPAPTPAPAVAPAPAPGPTSLAAAPAAAAPRAKGAPVGLLVALGVVIILLLGGLLAMQLLGHKPATTATGPGPQAQPPAVAAVPIPTVTILPTSAPPSPGPAAPTTPPLAGAPPEMAQQPGPSKAVKPRAVAAAAPHAARRVGPGEPVDESDSAPARRSNVPDEGDEAPPH